MNFTSLLYEVEQGIAVITLNRPHALNALNGTLMRELSNMLDEVAGDKKVKVLIITGSGEKAFAAGADIAEMNTMTALEGREWGRLGQETFTKLEKLPQPVIAAVNGFALGGGCELAMACDIRIVADNAKFGQPEVSLGIPPGFGGTQRLPRLVGRGRALELLLTGDMIAAPEALRIGLANRVVPQADLMAETRKMAQTILKRGNIAVSITKAAVHRGMETDLVTGLAYEAEVFGLCFATHDQQEGMSAFLEKRKANFSGK